MKINIMVNDLKQLQDWVTKTQQTAEKLRLPVFDFDFGTCKRCETEVHYPRSIDVNREDEKFDVLCYECGVPLERK